MLRIHLYLGAHKTATTHLQGILIANRSLLAEHGIKLSVPQDIRRSWLPKFFKYCSSATRLAEADLARELRAIAPHDGLWILTEENIPGVSNDFVIKAGMYPMAGDRLKCLVELFPDAEISLFFSLRSYDSFYRSAYSEVVRNRGYIPFEEFFNENRFKGNSWEELAHRFAAVLPPERVFLWKFEEFPQLLPELVQRLTGIEPVQDLINAYDAETTRPSLSQKTMDLLAELYPVLEGRESVNLIERINRAYPVSSQYAAYRPFSEQQECTFKEQYENDVTAIKANFPNLSFLHP